MTLNEEKGEIVLDIAMSMAMCRAGAVASEMTLTHVSKLAGNSTDMFVIPVPLSI